MTDELEHINQILVAHNKALDIIRTVPGVIGAHIVSLKGVPLQSINSIKTRTLNMPDYFSLSEIESYVEDYCQAHCLFTDDDKCLFCALRGFIRDMYACATDASEGASE